MHDDLFYQLIVSAGAASYDLSHDIASLTWEQKDSEPDELTLVVPDGHKVMSHALKEGMGVVLRFGTASHHSVVFRGRIHGVEGSCPPSGAPTLKIRALNRLAEMGLGRVVDRSWDEVRLSLVVKDILKPYQLGDIKIDPSSNPYVDPPIHYTHANLSDLEALSELCEAYGCVMYSEPSEMSEVFHFVGISVLTGMAATHSFAHGRVGVDNPLTEFNGTVDSRRAATETSLVGIDRKTHTELTPKVIPPMSVGEARDPYLVENLASIEDPVKRTKLEKLIEAAPKATKEFEDLHTEDKKARIIATNLTSQAELDLKAENWASVNALGMTASGSCSGTPSLKARSIVNIDDVGGRFSGRWYVTSVRHTVGKDGYQTEFSCKR